MFSVHIDVCKTHAKPWVRLAFYGGGDHSGLHTCDFAGRSLGDSFGWDFFGSWLGGVPCGKQLAGKIGGTRALRCNMLMPRTSSSRRRRRRRRRRRSSSSSSSGGGSGSGSSSSSSSTSSTSSTSTSSSSSCCCCCRRCLLSENMVSDSVF